MESKSSEFLLIISFLVLIPARYALWCPEGCYCDNENLFVNCGNEGMKNENQITNISFVYLTKYYHHRS